MTVSNSTSAGTSSSTAAGASGSVASALGSTSDLSQMFMQLLVAQIQDQDPTQPADPSQYVTQLAQLSQLQSLQTMASQGGTTNSTLQGLQAMTLGEQVGSQVGVTTSSITLGSSTVQGEFTLANAESTASVVLTNAAGQQFPFSVGAQSAGQVSFSINPTSVGLQPGPYTIAVTTGSGETPPVQMIGTLQSVSNSTTNGVMVNVSGLGSIPASQITSYNGFVASTTSSTSSSSSGN